MGGMIALPQRFVAKPQYEVSLSPEFRPYNPAIIVLPASARNIATGKSISFANDTKIQGGNFYFPGVDGYVDLGSDAIIGGSNYSFVVVSKLDSFVNSFPVIFGAKNTINANLMAFYSNSGGYADITIGQNGIGVPFSLSQFGSVTGTWHELAFVNSGGTSKLWCNGVSLTAGAAQALGGSTGNSCLGQLNPTSLANDFAGSIAVFVLFNGILPDALARELSANPWRLFSAPARRVYVASASSSGVGSATGTSTVSGVGAADSASVGSSSGVGAVSGVGASTASSVGSSSGTSTVDGVGTSSTGSSGSAAGTSTVSGAGSSTAASTGSASGVASVSGIGASEAATVGSSAGSATVSGVGDSTSAGSAVGTASGTSAVSGAGASTFSAVGSASGTSTVTGIAGGTPATGGHFAGDYRKNRKRSFERDDEIRRLILEQIEDVREEIAQAEVPKEVKQQARAVIRQTASLDLEAVQQELAKVRQMLRQFEQDDDEELLFMFH